MAETLKYNNDVLPELEAINELHQLIFTFQVKFISLIQLVQ